MTTAPDPDEVRITNADRVLFPDGTSKGDLAAYYRRVAEVILPHLRDRPLMLQRFPHGIDRGGFYQKDLAGQVPDWLDTVSVGKEGGRVCHAVCQNAASLRYLANLDTITLHGWLAPAGRVERPDRLVFDLDPSGEVEMTGLRTAARQVRDLLRDADLDSFVQTTGSRGLHVVAPLDGAAGFDEVRTVARGLADRLAEEHPDTLTTEARTSARRGRIYLDVMRNAYAQTAVVPYSVRARDEPTVATPLRWDELSDSDLHPARYTIHNVTRRLAQLDDPWADLPAHGRSLARARERVA